MERVRRTQVERTAATRGALLAATVESLVDSGYRGTTTAGVARRAGVSYGALLHHFPTKASLLCAAVEHLFEERIAEFRKVMADLPPGSPKTEMAIDVLWTMFQSPAFTAWLELWVAARTDLEIRDAVCRVNQQFIDTSIEIFGELFADETAQSPELPRIAIGVLYSFLDGLTLARLIPGHQPVDPLELLGAFKVLISTALPTDPERR